MKALPIKNEFGAGILELSRMASTEFITVSRKITDRPCWVVRVIVDILANDKTGLATLRNGETSTSQILAVLFGQYSCPILQGGLPVYFNKGLYIEFGEDTTGVMVQYLEDSR